MAETKAQSAEDLANRAYDLGGQMAADLIEAFAKKGITLNREQLGMMASGFTVGAAFMRAKQAVASGECPNCAKIDFLMTAHTALGDAVDHPTQETPNHGKAH